MKQRVEEMEKEANRLRELQAAAEKAEQGSTEGGDPTVPMETDEDRTAADTRSIFVGNVSSVLTFSLSVSALTCSLQVDYASTPEEIQQHFQACGTINRVTILCDKFTGHPKGYVDPCPHSPCAIILKLAFSFAYVEFAEPEFVDAALAMDNSLFRGRLIKVHRLV